MQPLLSKRRRRTRKRQADETKETSVCGPMPQFFRHVSPLASPAFRGVIYLFIPLFFIFHLFEMTNPSFGAALDKQPT